MLRLTTSAALIAVLAVPAMAGTWKPVARAPANLRITNLDGGDQRDLIAAASQLAPSPGEMDPETGSPGGWTLRRTHGAWRTARLLSGGRHASDLAGVWWLGDRMLAATWNSHADFSSLSISRDGQAWATLDDTVLLHDSPFHVAGQLVVAEAHGDLIRSLDGGSTWTEAPLTITCGDRTCPLRSVLPVGGPHLIALSDDVLRSDDAGDHWQSVAAAPADAAALVGDGADDGALYAVGAGLAASSDRGATWTTRALPDGAQAATLAAAGPATLYVGGARVWRSDDAGLTWRAEPLTKGSYGALHVAARAVYVVRFSDKGDEVLARPR